MEVFWLQVLSRYGDSLLREWKLAVAAVLSAVAGTLIFGAALPPAYRKHIRTGLILGAIAAGTAYALELSWVADDAFISFRYARNFADGHGLVFNPGEKVEGYTNFLWTVILAGGMGLGFAPVQLSLALSLFAAAGTVVLASHLAARLSGTEGGLSRFPLASIGLALNYTFASYGTSGLETMAGALCALVAVALLDRERPIAAGVASVMAAMLHPDHALFYGALGLILIASRRWKNLLRYGLPGLLLYVPYFLWRYEYYGALFPNTYYAKSGGLTYFTQGFRYLWISSVSAGLIWLLPILIYSVYRLRRSLMAQYVLVAVPLYLVYVAKIGGDFMLGRLMIAVLPPLAVVAEAGICDLWSRRKFVTGTVGTAFMAALVVPGGVIQGGEKYHHVADERHFYELVQVQPPKIRSPSEHWADVFDRHFVGLGQHPTIGIGCIGIVGYKTQLPIIDTFGLTDATVAKQPLIKRGRPGHEKRAHGTYLVERGVDFSDQHLYPAPYDALTTLKLDGLPFYLGRYDAGLWKKARKQGRTRLRRFEGWLDQYRPKHPTRGGSACDAWFMEQFYFRHNHDPKRMTALRKKFTAAHITTTLTQAFLLAAPGQNSGWRSEPLFTLDPGHYRHWTATGAGFASGPAMGSAGAQSHVPFASGGFANSFDAVAEDAPTGELLSAPFTVTGQVLTAQVGGGRNLENLRVELLIDNKTVSAATGCNSEILGRRVFDLTPYLGKIARIRLVDANPGGWGHLLVDEIQQWSHKHGSHKQGLKKP